MAKKLLSILMILLLSQVSVAKDGGFGDDFSDEDDLFEQIAGGEDEFEFIRYTPEYIQMSIREDMKVACKKGLCTLFAISESGDEFKAEFNVGQGDQDTDGGSSVVIVPGNGYTPTSTDSEYLGLSLSYTYRRCTQEVKVPRSLYIAMNTYMYGLISEEGTTRRAFTPADEAMIIFYSTIIKQASGCN